MAPLSANLCRR